MCTKCVNLSKADWTTIHKSRRRKLRRRKSADTLVKQDQGDSMENEGDQGQLFSQTQPPLSGVVANQPATPNVSEDEYEPVTQETHTQGVVSSALRRLEKDLVDPDADDFQGDPPRSSTAVEYRARFTATRARSRTKNPRMTMPRMPPPLNCHATARHRNRTRKNRRSNCH